MSDKKGKKPKKYSPAIKKITGFIDNYFEPIFTIALPFLALFSIITLAAGSIFGLFLAATSLSLYFSFSAYSTLWKDDLKDLASGLGEKENKNESVRQKKIEELNNQKAIIQEKKLKLKEDLKQMKDQINQISNPINNQINNPTNNPMHAPQNTIANQGGQNLVL